GSDSVIIGTIAPLAGGKLDGIDDLLTVSGDEDSDTITLDESGDDERNSAILDAATVNGFGMSGSISYEDMESVQIQLGSGIDQLRVEGTHDGTTKIVNKAGTDTVTMIDHQGQVTFVGGPENDKLLLDSSYLRVDGNTLKTPLNKITKMVDGRQVQGYWEFDSGKGLIVFESVERFNQISKLV
ncbi:MAG: hypothetical protein ACKN9U_06980, partial [Pirellulaceae bacterium]